MRDAASEKIGRTMSALSDANARIAALEASNARLRVLLKWAIEYINEGLEWEGEDRPIHECGYTRDPEKGSCRFCENYWGARDQLGSLPTARNDLKENTDGR